MAIKITPKLTRWLVDKGHCAPVVDGASDETIQTVFGRKTAEMLAQGELTAEKYSELIRGEKSMNTVTPEKMFSGGDGGSNIRVKAPSEAYDETRYSVKHAKTGQPVFDPIYQRECASMSEGSKARAGVLLKHLANKSGVTNNPLTEHERALLDEVCEKQAWCGKIGPDWYDWIGGDRNIKALIDDAPSGGLEIVPIEFDADVVTFPLLGGEIFPFVDLKEVPRGRRIEGASISTPTMAWGGGDDSAISLFNTANMVAAINTTVFAIDGTCEIGLDTMADSPVAIGETLTALVGERLRNQLDYVVGNGNGTTQPEGLFVAGGVGTVASVNGNAGPPTLADYTNLMFGVGKQYRQRALSPVTVHTPQSQFRKELRILRAGGSLAIVAILAKLILVSFRLVPGMGQSLNGYAIEIALSHQLADLPNPEFAPEFWRGGEGIGPSGTGGTE